MKYNNHLYWIGVRESEIFDTDNLFNGSITTYGSNTNGNYAFDKTFNYRYDCNDGNKNWINFINDKAKAIISNDSNAKFMLYYSPEFSELDEQVKKRVFYNNNDTIIDFLDNKITTRIWMAEITNTVPFIILSKNKIKYKSLIGKFPGFSKFVLQCRESSGGNKTILLNKNNVAEVIENLSEEEVYSISPYIEKNISINVHMVIYEDEVLILPSSIQIIQNIDNHLSYMGNDFSTYSKLDKKLKKMLYNYSLEIGNHLRKIGYLGVCGLDFIVTTNDVIFMEINPRFQASTVLLNKQLIKAEERLSVQKLHIDAFNNSKCSFDISNLKINQSIYFYKYKDILREKLIYCHNMFYSNGNKFYCCDDGLDWNYSINNKSYLFSLIVNQNISSIDFNNNLVLDQNIDIYNSEIMDVNSVSNHLIELKIMLLNQGIRLSSKAEEFINDNGGLNYEEFQAVDMKIFNKYFNVPIFTRLTCISPFEIDILENNKFVLKYYGILIGEITIRTRIIQGDVDITPGIKASDITYMSNDRLRIFHRNGCYYKENNIGCKFCDVENKDNNFSMQMIKTAIELYSKCNNINHYLIGGGSEKPNSNFENIFEVVKFLRNKNDKKISIMTTPPKQIETIKELKKCGVDEVIFNLEIFDRNIAKNIMPGKGTITLLDYTRAFENSVQIFGKGNVRSMLVLGLEPEESFLKGIEYLCSLGVYPTISLFKPIPQSPLSYLLPPSNKDVFSLYNKAKKICENYNVSLGPNCRYCEDNTIKISD